MEYLSDMYDEADIVTNVEDLSNYLYCNDCDLSNYTIIIGANGQTNYYLPKNEPVLCIVDKLDDEDRMSKKMLSGKRGQEIRNYLFNIANIEKQHLYFTPMVSCPLTPDKEIKDDHINRCLPRVRSIINILKPKLIILIGNLTVRYLLDTEDSIRELMLPEENLYNNIPLAVVQNPAELLYVEDNPRIKKSTEVLLEENFRCLAKIYLNFVVDKL